MSDGTGGRPTRPYLAEGPKRPCMQICFAKAKAFGYKRVVHRVAIPFADLVGRRTTLTWVDD